MPPDPATAPSPTPPRVARTLAGVREEVARLRASGRPVALVPTMGALHAGHLSLMRRAAEDGHAVAMSLFVNPTQFGAGEDLSRYPRDEAGDLAAAAGAGVELVYAPDAAEVYPPGFATEIRVAGPAEGLEGAARPTHFAGVATVVAKLLLAVRPDRVVLGQKDAQQVAVVRRMMRDLHLDDIELVVGPTVREADGLAMSSRNAYLGPEDRRAAVVLRRACAAAEALVAEGETEAGALAAAARETIAAEGRCALEYAEVVDPDTFHPVTRLTAPALLVVAARVGPARLIDNVALTPRTSRSPVPPRSRTMLKSKIHRATVTDANLDYVGSITLDTDLLRAADIRPYEQVAVVNIANGARFETYAIEGPAGGGDVCLNGAAARLAHPGDLIIVLTYADYAESELDGFEPTVVHVDAANRQVGRVFDTVPASWGEGSSPPGR